MIDTVFVFDTEDVKLGSFFNNCKLDLEKFCQIKNHDIIILEKSKLNELSISMMMPSFDTFIFGAYSHGGENCLVTLGNKPYISTGLNNRLFNNSFFYTFSCSSGKELGLDLVNNDCLCFIGYKRVVSIWDTFQQPFVNTANYGLKLFFEEESSEKIIVKMKDKYNEEIDNLYKDNYIIASILTENRNALVMHGNDIKILDLK